MLIFHTGHADLLADIRGHLVFSQPDQQKSAQNLFKTSQQILKLQPFTWICENI